MRPFKATLITQISPNLTYNKVDALLFLKNVSQALVNTTVNTIQKLKHSNLITDLTKDNTWPVPTNLENKQMLMHNSVCSQFVSTAFCKIAVERFMKVEKLGSTTEFGRKKLIRLLYVIYFVGTAAHVGGFIIYSGVTPPFYRNAKSVLSHKETLGSDKLEVPDIANGSYIQAICIA